MLITKMFTYSSRGKWLLEKWLPSAMYFPSLVPVACMCIAVIAKLPQAHRFVQIFSLDISFPFSATNWFFYFTHSRHPTSKAAEVSNSLAGGNIKTLPLPWMHGAFNELTPWACCHCYKQYWWLHALGDLVDYSVCSPTPTLLEYCDLLFSA